MEDDAAVAKEGEILDIDPIWTTSRTARQIYALGVVEKDITGLLSLAGSSISLLTLPQTDGPDDNLPQGEERSEKFVLEVSEYFEKLDCNTVIAGPHSACTNSTVCHQRTTSRLRSSVTWRGAASRTEQPRQE